MPRRSQLFRSYGRKQFTGITNDYDAYHAFAAFRTRRRPVGTRRRAPADRPARPVYNVKGRFAGWPANHGAWSWGDEFLVAFSADSSARAGPMITISIGPGPRTSFSPAAATAARPGRSRPLGRRNAQRNAGQRHAAMPPGLEEDRPTDFQGRLDFSNPHFALFVRMESHRGGASHFYESTDRGMSWCGPYRLPLFGLKGVMGRTDYLVNSLDRAFVFLTGTKSNGIEGRPFVVRDRGRRPFLALPFFHRPRAGRLRCVPLDRAALRSELVTAVRASGEPHQSIEAFASHDGGKTWSFLATPAPDTGDGNPPCLTLCLMAGCA